MNRAVILFTPLLLVACAKATDPSATAGQDTNDQQQMQRSVDETMLAVRLKAAEARIVELERQVGALEATPEKVDLQLLTQRLEQLETRVYAGAPPAGGTSVAPTGTRASDPTPKPAPSTSPSPSRFNPFGL